MILAGVILLAVVARRLIRPGREALDKLLLCASLALVPILCLYAISVTTSVHVFIPRYLLVAVPGIALCWGWLCSLIDSRALRAFFCFAFVGLCVFQAYSSPLSRRHEESWKEALAFADANAAVDHAPSADVQSSGGSRLSAHAGSRQRQRAVLAVELLQSELAQVLPLPRTLNAEAERQAKQFLLKAAQQHTRFLLLAPWPSLRMVDLLAYTRRARTPIACSESSMRSSSWSSLRTPIDDVARRSMSHRRIRAPTLRNSRDL